MKTLMTNATKKRVYVGFDVCRVDSKPACNAIKAQLGEGSRKANLYTKPYTKRIDLLCMPHG